MDSINKQQPEHNTEHLAGNDAVKKMKEIGEKNKTCYFSTFVTESKVPVVRPMSVQQIDEEGNFWFLSANDSNKNRHLQNDSTVQLLFQGTPHSDFMAVSGNATITTDKEKIKELWEPLIKTWFTEGVDDPRITVIKIEPTEGYYWDNKHGNAVAFVKMAIGAMTGKTLDDAIEGKLKA